MRDQIGQLSTDASVLVAGDAGLLVVRSLLEAGVATIAAHLESPTQLADTLVATARSELRERCGVRVRRIPASAGSVRSLHPVESAGVVAFLAGTDDARLLDVLAGMAMPAIVIVPESAWSGNCPVPVMDPPPTVDGFRAAVQMAARAAAASRTAVGVLLRNSLAEGYYSFVTSPLPPALRTGERTATGIHDLLPCHRERARGNGRIVVSSTAWEPVIERLCRGAQIDRLVLPIPSHPDLERLGAELADCVEILVLDEAGQSLYRAVCTHAPEGARITVADCSIDTTSERELRSILAQFAPEVADLQRPPVRSELADDVRNRLMRPPQAPAATDAIPAAVLLGMSLAQPGLGIPARAGDTADTWRTGTGLSVRVGTYAGAAALVEAACTDGCEPFLGVLVCRDADHAAALAAKLEGSATLEYVSTAQPRAIGAAIARIGIAGGLRAPHFLAVVPGAGLIPGDHPTGIEPDLVANDPALACGVDATSNPLGLSEISPAVVAVGFGATGHPLSPGRLAAGAARTVRRRTR